MASAGRVIPAAELAEAAAESQATGHPARRFKDFLWTTLDSWSRRRRVIGKAECTKGEPNPRFVVTSLKPNAAEAQYLYEKIYCARGEMENRIKECQLDLFGDRTSAATMRANQLRLSPRWPMCCSARSVGSASSTPSSPPRLAAPAVWRSSRSALWCGSAFGASTSPWPRAARGRTSSDWPTYGSPVPPADEPETASPITPHRAQPATAQPRLNMLKMPIPRPQTPSTDPARQKIHRQWPGGEISGLAHPDCRTSYPCWRWL